MKAQSTSRFVGLFDQESSQEESNNDEAISNGSKSSRRSKSSGHQPGSANTLVTPQPKVSQVISKGKAKGEDKAAQKTKVPETLLSAEPKQDAPSKVD